MIIGSGVPRPKRGTSLVISHASALEAYRRARWDGVEDKLLEDLYPDAMIASLGPEALAADESLRPLELPANARDMAARANSLIGHTGKLDVIVGRAQARRAPAAMNCHVWCGPVSDGLISCLDTGVYLSGPELLFAQMARQLGKVSLLELAYELCGTYVIGPDGQDSTSDIAPLTTPERLRWVAGACSGVKGANAIRWAASRVLAGSNSPMETKLAILLSLPRSEGGWGCEIPLLNHHIDLTREAQEHCGRTYLVADLYFERSRTDVEYHGEVWHRRLASKKRDDARTNALDMMGIDCNVVWGDQIYSEEALSGVAALIRKRANMRPHRTPESTKMRLARSALIDELRRTQTFD